MVMAVRVCAVLTLALACSAWRLSPRTHPSRLQWVVAAGLGLGLGLMTPAAQAEPLWVDIVHAADSVGVFAGNYADPFHPGCKRSVTVDGDKVKITGSDQTDGSGEWVIFAKSAAGAGRILVDFSPKGGPPDLLGVFDAKDNSIHWPDGNAWKKL